MFDTSTQTQQKPPTLIALPVVAPASALTVLSADAVTMSQWAIVFETFLEKVFPFQGFMLLDHQGTLVQSSPYAQELCRAMDCEVLPQRLKPLNPKEWLPIKISSLIRCLRESRQRLPEHRIQLQEVVVLRDHTRLRLAANWIELEPQQPACIVVTLENLTAIAHQQALTDARRHQLTERESQVWECALLGLSYSEIGQELFISINTVKRHMKSIHRKQEG